MVDAHVSGACVERRASSSLVPGTSRKPVCTYTDRLSLKHHFFEEAWRTTITATRIMAMPRYWKADICSRK